MTDTLEALEALIAAGTPGPWDYRRNSAFWEFGANGFDIGDTCSSSASEPKYGQSDALGKANAALIVAAVNALPGHIAEIKRLREALKITRMHLEGDRDPYVWIELLARIDEALEPRS